MRNLLFHGILIFVVAVLAVWKVYPPSQTLPLAKDLQGGTSLVYQVNIGALDSPDTMNLVRELLKRRLDPDGLLDIGIEQQSGNRIEITMPLPRTEVLEAKAQFERALAQLGSANITADQFDAAMKSPTREDEIKRLGAGDSAREQKIRDAAAKFDRVQEAGRTLSSTLPALQQAADDADAALVKAKGSVPPAPKEVLDQFQKARDDAQLAVLAAADAAALAGTEYDAARAAALASSISSTEVRRMLALSTDRRKSKSEATGELTVVDSARDRAMKRLSEKYPGAKDKLAGVLAEWDAYRTSRRTLDDVEDLKRLMRASGALTFRIAPKPSEALDEARLRQELRERGPRNVKSTDFKWFKLSKLDSWFKTNEEFAALVANPAGYFAARSYVVDEFDGEYFMLCYDTPWRGTDKKRLTAAEGAWRLASSQPSQDELGRPCIVFNMDTLGADKMGQLTGSNIANAMSVLLDDEVITAPTLQDRISGSGRITGSFSMAEINYIVRVLNAGSLAAKISPDPISDNTIGPELGADNLKRGLSAGMIAFVVVSGFMIVYYFAGGVFAVLALMLNGTLILAAMSANNAAFSLPGIAGVILTFGMAVDANVLIYERMREEMQENGADLRTAVRLGYQRALASIIDGNLTNLIVCVVLMWFGTQEIKGFAITMTIGTLTTLFCQLYVTRVLFSFFVDKLRWRKMQMLPMAVPALHRLLSPNVDWMKYRWHFASVSIVLTSVSLAALVYRGSSVLDTEFQGGTKVTVNLRRDGKPIEMNRSQVEEKIKSYAIARGRTAAEEERALAAIADPVRRAEASKTVTRDKLIADLETAEIICVNPESDGVTSSTFIIKTGVDNADLVQDAVADVFRDYLPTLPKLSFERSGLVLDGPNDARVKDVPARPITTTRLSEVLDIPQLTASGQGYVGGLVLGPIVFNKAEPLPSLDSLRERLEQAKRRPQFTASVPRKHEFILLSGTANAVESAALLVHDDQISFLADESQWAAELRYPEWNLLVDSLTLAGKGASVESFSPAVASSFVWSAVYSVGLSTFLVVIYIFVRFNSMRYSLAAIATTLHDCLVAVGFIALAGIICSTFPRTAAALGLLPFKIDLNVIAAVLTILGYSLNDTIIVMDRIREKRGKLPYASRAVINMSINQTVSRTIITAGTTFLATLVLYLFGGEAVRSFAFSFLVGVIVGTYSSIAVAAPIVWVRAVDPNVGGPEVEAANATKALTA